MQQRGRVTIPTDVDVVPETLTLMERSRTSMPSFEVTYPQNLETNFDPRSEMIDSGIPC